MSNDTAIESLQEKIDDLNQQAWNVRITDLPKSFELSEESVKLARSINYPKGLAEGLRSLGFSYVRLSKNDEAAPLLKESLSFFQSLNDLKGQAVIYEYLGIIERNWGNLGASLDLLLKANELVLQIGSQEIEITCSYQLGVTYKHLGDHENALDYLYKTLSLAKKINNPLMQAYATNIIGSIYFDNGNYNQALDCYQQGLPIRRQSNDKWGEAGSLDNIGFTYLKLNDLDKAIDHCKQSLAICQATGDKKGEANALLHLGEIYEQAGDIKQAAAFSNESLEIRKERGDKRGETEVLLFLAELYKNRNDVEDHQIFEWLSNALKIADEVKAQDLLSKTHYNLHEYYRQKGNFKESLAQLEAHFQIEKELHKNSINQKIANLEISHKAEVISQRNKELTELNEKIKKANEELKIESALEKVRSRSLAMHKSEELRDVVSVVFEKLAEFITIQMDGVSILIPVKGSKDIIEWVASEGKTYPEFFKTPYIDNPILTTVITARDSGVEFLAKVFDYEEKNALWKYAFEHSGYKNLPEEMKKRILESRNYAYSVAFQKNSAIVVASIAGQVLPENESEILKRFAKVFEQAYTRFLDLQKAEAQAREAKIEAALEKVRSRSMAMHKSEEVMDVAVTVYDELQKLDFNFGGATIIIMNKETGFMEHWLAGFIQKSHVESYQVNNIHHPLHAAQLAAWRKGEKFVSIKLSGTALKEYAEEMFTQTGYKNLPDEEKAMLSADEEAVFNLAYMSHGALMWAPSALSDEKAIILQRFTKVFEQTYTRFLDLQKAESQAREAKIEAALEKVRSRSMAMHQSDELRDVVKVVFDKLEELNFVLDDRAVGIFIFKEGSNDHTQWFADPEHLYATSFEIPFTDHSIPIDFVNAKKSGADYFSKIYPVEEKNEYFKYLFANTDYKHLPGEIKDLILGSQHYGLSVAFAKNSAIVIPTNKGKLLEDNEKEILQRFVKVFDQAYTRFLDLQKAEAQAREANIEAALERVRSRSMAMHKSDELREVVAVLFAQLQHIGFDIKFCTIALIDKVNSTVEFWLSGFSQEILPESYHVPNLDHPFYQNFQNTFRQGTSYKVFELAGEAKRSYDKLWFTLTDFKNLPEPVKKPMMEMERVVLSCAFTKNGMIQIGGFEPLSDLDASTVQRFAKVFEQTYTRFLDLQKAEAQARESQIELALERVRARTMAMQRSDELREAVLVIYEQLQQLNFESRACNIIIIDKESGGAQYWVSGFSQEIFAESYKVPYLNHPYQDALLNPWKQGDKYAVYEYTGQMKQRFDEIFFTQTEFRSIPEEAKKVMVGLESVTLSTAFISYGALQTLGAEPLSEEKANILKRFAKVFEQTYTRFLDLKKAEAQAREAQIEAALEKVRSRTLAMQKSDELAETAAEVFRQLIALGIEPNRLYIGIVKEETGDMEMWATDEDGTQVGKRFMFNKNENASVLKLYDGWKAQKKSVIVDMQGKELEDYFHYLNNVMHIPFKGGLTQKRRVQSVAYFSKGFIGMASPDGQGDETIQLLERFAAVFNLTFTRFNDLKIAEAHAVQAKEDLVKLQTEKKRAEDALSELQVTQKQLIQSEKMASLGELTAGIAHEIQNPLNFVNNFSDVNKELLAEMKEEIEKGNTEEVIAIANDIISNEEKINHHGKRADAIVKGMLQHSRSSSGVKEPTDINELADEYLRLAYHGLRAKDKTFNATMKTDFDEKVGKVNVIPQDIGRVFLNLITNAFYVVSEKKKQLANGYEPTVTVTTKKESDQVVVSVKDNGNGIPQKVLDKIFQPFFTTKPTGQGTGLGLSLSYDIVKAHSGEIKVKTKDGEGSEFVIQLPIGQ